MVDRDVIKGVDYFVRDYKKRIRSAAEQFVKDEIGIAKDEIGIVKDEMGITKVASLLEAQITKSVTDGYLNSEIRPK